MSETINVQENLHIKLQFNDEFRRFNVPKHTKFAELIEKIKQILTLDKDFTVKYKDDENEWITMSSDIELDTGLSFAKSSLLRLLVSVKSQVCGFGGPGSCPEKWRARWRKRMEENGDEGCGKKWRRHKWGKMNECDDTRSEGECKRWKRGGKWKKDCDKKKECENDEEDVESGECKKKWRRRKWRDCDNEEGSEGECKRRKRGGKWKKDCHKNECEDEEDVESGDCKKKWRRRKWRDCDNEEGSEGECKKGRRRHTDAEREEWREKKRKMREEWREKRRKEKWGDEDEVTQKDPEGDCDINSGDELLNLEQIKKEIETLKVSADKLRERSKEYQQQLVALRNQLKEKRKGGALDDVLSLRKLLKAKKEEKTALSTELRKIVLRTKSLQKLAKVKSV